MTTYVQNFLKFQPLLKELIARDIKVKYRKSVLGVLWTLLNPLFMMIVLSVVFSNLFKFDVEYFPVYLLSGQLIFNFYSEVTTCSMSAIIDNGPLIKKGICTKIFVHSGKNIFKYHKSAGIIYSFDCCYACHACGTALYSITGMDSTGIYCSVFSLGMGLLLSAIAVKFRDIMHLYSVFVTALMYLTPVIYPMSILPEWLKPIVLLNPLTNILQMFRGVMMYNSLPGIKSILIAAVECVVMLVIGLYVFYKRQDSFILDI